ncbi:MAG TPA: hypothetical protein LFW20_07370 [Rickettsia endosymbiont of Omalisus fontisbellaquei]|nr:hypothetical protein [Rickettsia endosymbiont of Omalisus fontisbellaquei]
MIYIATEDYREFVRKTSGKLVLSVKENVRLTKHHLKEGTQEIDLCPNSSLTVEEPNINLVNNTLDRAHTYVIDNNECLLTGDVLYLPVVALF